LSLTACSGPSSPLPKQASPGAKIVLGPAGVPAGVIELRRWREPAERVVIEPSGVSVGPEGAPLVHYLFVSRDRLRDLGFFVRTYAPFRIATPRGELAFGGRGAVPPGPVGQRMILEWARTVAAEVAAGRGGVAYGLAFAWHRGGSVGSCDDVAVYLNGEVRASSCSWGDEVRGRLAPEQLARVYAWFDGLAPFQAGGDEGNGNGREPSRLVFAGVGRKEATPEQMDEIRALAPALHRELAARHPGAPAPQAPLAAEGTPAGAEKKKGETQEAAALAAPSGRLLLPPDTAPAGAPPAAIPPDLQPPPGSPAPKPTAPRNTPPKPAGGKAPSPPAPLPSPTPPSPREGSPLPLQ
jgi:hypothetical protein